MKSFNRYAQLAFGISSVIGAAAVSLGCPGDPVANEVQVVNSFDPVLTYDSTYVGDTISAHGFGVYDGTDKVLTVPIKWTSSNSSVVKVVGDGQSMSTGQPPQLVPLAEGDAIITGTLAGNYKYSSGAAITYHENVSVAGPPASIKIVPTPISLQVFAKTVPNAAAFITPGVVVRSASGRQINSLSVDLSEVTGNAVAEFCSPFADTPVCSRTATYKPASIAKGIPSIPYYGIKVGSTRLAAKIHPVTGRTFPNLADTVAVIVGGGTVVVTNTSLSGSLASSTAFVGEVAPFFAAVKTADGANVPNPAIVWSTSRPEYATIDNTGKLTVIAAAADRDTLTVLANVPALGLTGKFVLFVQRRAAFVAFTPGALSLNIGGTGRALAHFTDASGKPVTYLRYAFGTLPKFTIGDTSIAIVRTPEFEDTTATVVGIKAGTTTLTMTFGTITASIPVNIFPTVRSITLQYTSGTTTRAFNVADGESIAQGATAKIVATALDVNGTPFNDQFTFSTTATGITLAPSGLNTVTVTGATVGTAYPLTISAASDPTLKITTKISVTSPVPLGGPATKLLITSTPANAIASIGGQVQYATTTTDATGAPASGCTVEWNTDASAIGRITATGLATGVGAGATAVRASCIGSNVGSASKFTVTDGTFGVTRVAITPKKYEYVNQGGTSTFAATVTQNSTGAMAPVVWSIDAASTTAGVTIDQTGTVRVPNSGSTTFGGGVKITATAGGQTDIAWLTFGYAGSARGTITSTSGRYVGGSVATATPTNGGAQISSAVDDNGQFYLVGLAPGSYTIFVYMQGVVASQMFNNVTITPGQTVPIVLTAFPIR
jgi:hypothetical protein